MTIYPGARAGRPREPERVEHASAAEYVWHARHFWRLRGCYAWVTTIRVREGGAWRIIGEHIA